MQLSISKKQCEQRQAATKCKFGKPIFLSFCLYKTMDLKIASLNARGLGNNTKRREVFNWLRAKKFSIYMLQEVHCSKNTSDLWACEWGFKAFLVAAQVTERASVFSSTTILVWRFLKFF